MLEDIAMGKVGRFITDPKAGAYCQVTLDSGDKLVINHAKGGFKGGPLTMETSKWWGGGHRIVVVDLDGAAGKAALAKLTAGHPAGSALATPLGAFAEFVKDCASVDEVKAKCDTLLAG
jgi:hypothetical protein